MNKVINSYMLQLMPDVIQRLKYTIEGKDDRHLFPLLSLPSSQQLAVKKKNRIFFFNNQSMLVVLLKSINASNPKLLAGKACYHLKNAKLRKQKYI